jgi:hypothetical protein
MAIKKVRVDKRDYFRSLLTDTSPYDVPVIFSNDGLYLNLTRASENESEITKRLVSLIQPDSFKSGPRTIPFIYKIKTSSTTGKVRSIGLTHPISQIIFAEFYRDYANVIIDWCSKSPYSIRSPSSLTSSFYIENKFRKALKKREAVDLDIESELSIGAASYFRYSGYNRIYKFYESANFIELESSFPCMMELDVSNCFGNIYTHSLSWAIKGKKFSKDNLYYPTQIPEILDKIMQNSNYGETVGIPVGPETSRVFSEIIFQEIDSRIHAYLDKDHNLEVDLDYSIYRYVDDFIVFSKSPEDGEKIRAVISVTLSEFKLSLNDNKTTKYQRPFITTRSQLTFGLKKALSYFTQTIFQRDTDGKNSLQEIRNVAAFERSFITRIKAACYQAGIGIDSAASFLIPALASKVERLIIDFREDSENSLLKADRTYRVLQFCIAIQTYLCRSSGNDAACDRLASTILITDEFVETHLKSRVDTHRQMVASKVERFVLGFDYSLRKSGVVPVGILSLLCSLRTQDSGSRISDKVFTPFLADPDQLNYFEIVTLLYCWGSLSCYDGFREQIEAVIDKRLTASSEKHKNSEEVHLFLDCICCPYISEGLRIKLAKSLYREDALPQNFREDVRNQLGQFWFIEWDKAELYSRIIRKQYRASY